MFPDISILPLDLDPDTSYANLENRLQMLIMNRNRFEAAQTQVQEVGSEQTTMPVFL